MSNETIQDIVREMREPLPEFELGNKDVERLLRFYAHRIEDASLSLIEEVKNAVNKGWEMALQSEGDKVMQAVEASTKQLHA